MDVPLRLMGEGVQGDACVSLPKYVSIKIVWMPLLTLYYNRYVESSIVLNHGGPSVIAGPTSRKRNEPGWSRSATEIQSLTRLGYERV